jgi:hypothetical protein
MGKVRNWKEDSRAVVMEKENSDMPSDTPSNTP